MSYRRVPTEELREIVARQRLHRMVLDAREHESSTCRERFEAAERIYAAMKGHPPRRRNAR